MGYGITTSVVYGVELAPDDSAKLHAFLAQGPMAQSGLDLFDWLEENELVLVADGSDSRIHNTQYQPGFAHCFGVLIADKGYGGTMSAEEYKAAMKADRAPLIARFEDICRPLLQGAGIEAEAGELTASCTD